MNRKVKVISYRNNLITLEIDGQRLCYFVDRPQPLGPGDASITTMFRNVMDTRMMETLTRAAFELSDGGGSVGVLLRFVRKWKHFLRLYGRSDSERFTAALIAKRLGEVGVPFEVGGTKCLAILQSDIKNLKKKGVI